MSWTTNTSYPTKVLVTFISVSMFLSGFWRKYNHVPWSIIRLSEKLMKTLMYDYIKTEPWESAEWLVNKTIHSDLPWWVVLVMWCTAPSRGTSMLLTAYLSQISNHLTASRILGRTHSRIWIANDQIGPHKVKTTQFTATCRESEELEPTLMNEKPEKHHNEVTSPAWP